MERLDLDSMLSALSKTIAQMTDPAFRGVLWRSVAITTAVFVVLWIAAWFGLGLVGDMLTGWAESREMGEFWTSVLTFMFSALSVTSVLFASFFLFPAIVTLAMGFFLEDVAQAVERRHYPNLPAAHAQPVGEMIKDSLSLVIATVVINLLALPFYLFLLFVPPLNLFLFYGINGYLLGREYFEIVAARRMDRIAAKRLRRRFRGRVFLAGVIITFVLTIPLVNLVAPILATGFLLHVVERLRHQADTVSATA